MIILPGVLIALAIGLTGVGAGIITAPLLAFLGTTLVNKGLAH